MTYNPNIPNPNDLLSDSQGDIKLNFQQANIVFDANHYTFNDGTTNKGKHKFVSLPVLANYAAIVPAPVAGEGTLYAKTAGSSRNLFYTPGATGNEFQITNCRTTGDFATFGTFTNYAPPVPNQNGGWTFLPGGLLLQYGRMTATGLDTAVVFPLAFDTIYTVTATRGQNSISTTTWGISAFNAAGFTFSSTSANPAVFFWQAIGSKN